MIHAQRARHVRRTVPEMAMVMRSEMKYVRRKYGIYRIRVTRTITGSFKDEEGELKRGRDEFMAVRSDIVLRMVSSVTGGGGNAGGVHFHRLNASTSSTTSGKQYLLFSQ